MKLIYRLQWAIRSFFSRFGYLPLFLLPLLTVCGLEQSLIVSLHQKKASINKELQTNSPLQSSEGTARTELPKTASESLTQHVQAIPTAGDVNLAMTRFYQAAEKQQIFLYQGEYHIVRYKYINLAAYEIELPVKASYPQLRRFINQALSDIPNLALESIEFKRQKVDEPTLEAQLKFTLYLRDE